MRIFKTLVFAVLAGATTTKWLQGIWGSSNGGASWSVFNSGTTAFLTGVWGSGPDDVYAVGNQVILHSVNRGTSWMTTPAAAALWAIWGSGPKDVYAAGDRGVILHSTDNGQSWMQHSENIFQFEGLWGFAGGDIYAVGPGEVFHSISPGTSWTHWTVMPGATDLQSVWGSGATDVYTVGTNGVILHGH